MADEYLNNEHRSDYTAVMTVADAFEEYIGSRDNLLSPSTIQGYRVIQRSRLQSIMNIRITELTVRDIQAAVNHDCIMKSVYTHTTKNKETELKTL